MAIEGIITKLITPEECPIVRDVNIFQPGATIDKDTKTRVRIFSAIPGELLEKNVEFDEQVERVVRIGEGYTQEYLVQNLCVPTDGIGYQTSIGRETKTLEKRSGIIRFITPPQYNDKEPIHVVMGNSHSELKKPIRLYPSWHVDFHESLDALHHLKGKLVEVEAIRTFYTREQKPICAQMTRRFTEYASGRVFEYSWFVD